MKVIGGIYMKITQKLEWDYEENDKLGIKPNELLVGSIKKVYWICSKGHKYDRSIYDRLHGRGRG